eukprot:Platyproteum_vivax@DN1191_c0_g1_i1.p1
MSEFTDEAIKWAHIVNLKTVAFIQQISDIILPMTKAADEYVRPYSSTIFDSATKAVQYGTSMIPDNYRHICYICTIGCLLTGVIMFRRRGPRIDKDEQEFIRLQKAHQQLQDEVRRIQSTNVELLMAFREAVPQMQRAVRSEIGGFKRELLEGLENQSKQQPPPMVADESFLVSVAADI